MITLGAIEADKLTRITINIDSTAEMMRNR